MTAPTRDDAQLMIQIAQWGTSLGIQDAIASLFADDFDPETAALDDEPVRTVLAFGETIGTLTKHDLLSVELMHDWLWLEGLWSRVGGAAVRGREALGEPRLYENFEALVQNAAG
jgi:hypothetical protein